MNYGFRENKLKENINYTKKDQVIGVCNVSHCCPRDFSWKIFTLERKKLINVFPWTLGSLVTPPLRVTNY